MNNKIGFGAQGIIFVIILLLIVGGVAYYVGVRNFSIKQSPENLKSSETTENDNEPQTVPVSNTKSITLSPIASVPVKNIANTQDAERVQVYVYVIDKDGKAFRPDTVEWYYPPVSGQVTRYPAKCVNLGCTSWSITGASASKIYVVANYKVPSAPGAQCFSAAYDAEPVELSNMPIEVTLTMKLDSYCY